MFLVLVCCVCCACCAVFDFCDLRRRVITVILLVKLLNAHFLILPMMEPERHMGWNALLFRGPSARLAGIRSSRVSQKDIRPIRTLIHALLLFVEK